MNLIKLVYIAHGWHLSVNKKPLIREDVEAWKYGLVVRGIYDDFKGYGKRTIKKPAYTGISTEIKSIKELNDKSASRFLDKIWDFYQDFSGLELSKITHKKRGSLAQNLG